jgi:hypothetical protein
MLTAEELLAGSELSYTIQIPPELVSPTAKQQPTNGDHTVRLRPLTIRDLQLATRAAKENDTLVAAIMVHQALVEPTMTIAQVAALPAGLVQFLLQHVNRISGITTSQEQMNSALDAPVAKAAFILAREYGWTPQEVNDLTLGQVLLHLQMLKQQGNKS